MNPGRALACLLLLTIGLVAGPSSAWAQGEDFFELSPGKLTSAHAEWDNTAGCTKCHELGKGVTNLLCLDCHQHRPLRDAIRKKRGLHATFKQPCRACHTEHKGRDAFVINWKKVGGRRNFKHDKTGFSLTGLHDDVACTACHKRKLKSGRTSYADLPRDCDGCHKNPHKFTNKALRKDCDQCHKAGVARNMKPKELPFDHGKQTGLALTGKHGKVRCVKCHKRAKMGMKKKRTCFNCHRNPHGKGFKKRDCAECHAPAKPWKKSTFNHDETGFALRSKHKTKRCAKCHKSKKKPASKCRSCHKDPHRKRFGKLSCTGCHGLGGSKRASSFKHKRVTGFALTSGHRRLSCRKCHLGRGPRRFKKFKDGNDCMGCHAHKNVHGGQFKDTPCGKCHKEGGSSNVTKFDHQKDARFALFGFHLELEEKGKCRACHPSDAFRTGKIECKDCHEDSHKGELGQKCERCHTATVHFKETSKKFDHNLMTAFPLEAKHVGLDCEKCHPKGNYKTGKERCVDCHAEDDKHDGMLGEDCARCHIPDKGAPKFIHDTMTAFTLTGVHLNAKCSNCHRESFPGGAPPKVGWTKAVAEAPLDYGFPVAGAECKDCHFDVHQGAYGDACQTCHETDSFQSANAAVHDTGAFRLMGTHDRLRCDRCHKPKRALTGLGVFCQGCHRQDDYHNNSLGPYCGRCHTQFDWTPARFNHSQLGIILRGAHKIAACRDCHGVGNYVGTPTDCSQCHLTDSMAVPDPIHTPEFVDCQNCHSEIAFSPAKRYHPWWPLSGSHANVGCSNCHQGGVYMGTPTECVGCHRTDYLATTRPNHQMVGFGEQCERCHNPTSFTPAQYTHQNFIRRGSHRVVDCETCHTGGNFTSAFDGLVTAYECSACHNTGAPVARKPADHDEKGYPPTCELCHNEISWTPAKVPR